MINCRQVNDNEVINYIDQELHGRLSEGDGNDVNFFVSGGFHFGLFNNDRLVGAFTIVAFGDDKEYAMLHPRINKSHMIYAKRLCDMAIDYIYNAGFKAVFANIPSDKKGNMRMAKSCGMTLVNVIDDCKTHVYRRSF